MKKKHWLRSFVAAVTASALVWSCAPVGALAAGPGTDGGTATTVATRAAIQPVEGDGWNLDADGVLTIQDDEGMSNWVNNRLAYLTEVKIVKLSSGVTSINANAFCQAYNLETIEIPTGVTSIGNWAFMSCSNLKSVEIPSSVTEIGDNTFMGCGLTSITIPGSVKTIGDHAFASSGLSIVTMLDGVESIGGYAFSQCGSLTTVVIPNSVEEIGADAFYCCYQLTNISLPNQLKIIENNTFYDCSSLTSMDIPQSVTRIEGSAFEGCGNLKKITIPESVSYIGGSAFRSCAISNIQLPKGITSIEGNTFSSCLHLTSITIPGNVVSIGKEAFSYCSNLESVIILNGVKSIGSSAFSNCSKLTSIAIPDSVTSIVGQVFFYTSNDLTAYCNTDSYAESYCKENEISYKPLSEFPGGYPEEGEESPVATTEWFGKVLSNTTNSITIDIDGEHTLQVAPGVDLDIEMTDNSLQNQYIYGTFDAQNRIVSLKVISPQVGTLRSAGGEIGVEIETDAGLKTYQWYRPSSIPGGLIGWMETPVQFYADGNEIFLIRSVKTVIGTPTAVNTSSTPATATIDGQSYAIADGFADSVSKVLNQKALFMLYNNQIEYAKALSSYAPHVDLSVSWNPDRVTYRNDQYDQTSLKASVTLTNPSSNFPDGVDLNALKQQPELNVQFTDSITLELSDGNNNGDVGSFLCFGDKYSDPWFGDPKVTQDVKVPQEKTTLAVGDSVTLEVPVSINSKYVPEQGITQKSVNVAVTSLPMTSGAGQTLEMPGGNWDTLVAAYPENAYVPMEDSEEVKDAAKEAAKELDKLDIEDIVVWIPGTNTIDSLLTKKQKNQIGIATLYTAISASTSEPVLTLEEQLNKDIVEKAFNKYFENWGFNQSVKDITFTLPMVLKTEDYGEIEFTITYTGGAYGMDDGGAFGQLGTLSYSITKGDLPAGFVKSGVCAYLVYADIDSFVNSCYDLIYSELKNAYDLAYGNDVNTIADALSCGAISDLLKNSKYKNLSGLTFAILTSFSTEYNAACPIDMYVYDENNNLQGAIVGDQVVKTTEDAVMEVIPNGNDTIKRATLWNSTYHLKIVATGAGNMDITVNEKAGDDVLRTVKRDDIPLTTGDTFMTTLQPAYKTNNYVMSKTNGDQEEGTIEPTSDQSYLVVDTETGDDETPGGSDHPSTPGGSGTPTPPPSNPSNPGTPSNPASPESEMTTKVTLQNGRTVTISSPDDVIEIPQSSTFEVRFQSAKSIPTFALTAGNGKSIATDTVSAWNPATKRGTYTLYGLGAPGTVNDTTGIYVNGVKLFSMKVVERPLTSDTTVDFAMRVGQTYQFWVKPDDPDASYTFNTANGDMLQTSIVKGAYPDAQGRYLCRLTVTGRGDTVGVYCNIDGNTYKLFTVNCQ